MAQTMTLTEARSVVTDSVLHVGASTYTDSKVDRAIRFAGNYFVEQTKCTKTSNDFTASSGVATIDATSTDPLFEPNNLFTAAIGYKSVQVKPWGYIARLYYDSTSQSGRPYLIAFRTRTEGVLYPTPDANYTIRMTYWTPFTEWTIGTGSPGSVTFNVPLRFMDAILWLGASSALLWGEGGTLYTSQGWQQFLLFINNVRGDMGEGPVDSVWDDRQYV